MSIFEQYKKTTSLVIVLVFVFIFLGLIEFILGKLGVGNPILYDSSAIYGYRPIANKTYQRYIGKKISFNNLALRSEENWDNNKSNKILFLGDSVTYGGSYISNDELFSYLAVKKINHKFSKNYISGNAGVNAWGVENVYGLVFETNFYPAKKYILTFPEGDFYRGLSRISGMPFYNIKPTSALDELWLYFCWLENNKRYQNWQSFASIKTKKYVLQKAINKLDILCKSFDKKGYKYIIFITPTKEQLLQKESKDKLLLALLQKKHNLKVVYLLDYLNKLNLTNKQIEKIYHDNIHLNKYGHKIWSDVISDIIEKEIDK